MQLTSITEERLQAHLALQGRTVHRLLNLLHRWVELSRFVEISPRTPIMLVDQAEDELRTCRRTTAKVLGLDISPRGLVTYSQG